MKLVKNIFLPESDTHFEIIMDGEGNYQRAQFDAALKYAKPEDRGLFIDIGAHVGLWSRMALKEGFKNILAFEPDSENYECLMSNIPPQNFEEGWILLYNFPLSDKAFQNVSIKNEKNDNSGAKILEEGNDLTTMTLDLMPMELSPIISKDKLRQNIGKTLIKIDVQGYEAKVVRGMKKFVQEYKPIIIVEQFLDGKEDFEATMILKSYGMKVLESIKKEVILGW